MMRTTGYSLSITGQMQVDGRVVSLTGASLADASICLYVPDSQYEQTAKLAADGSIAQIYWW